MFETMMLTLKEYKKEVLEEYNQLNKTEKESIKEDYENILSMIEQLQSLSTPSNALIESVNRMIMIAKSLD